MLLQDLDAIPPVNPVELVPKYAYIAGGSWAPWEGSLALVSCLGKLNLYT